MSIDFLVDAEHGLQSMKDDLKSIAQQVDKTWSIDVFTLNNLRDEAQLIRKKALSLHEQVYQTSMKLGMSNSRVRKSLENIIPIVRDVEREAKNIIREINAKDVISRTFAPIETVLNGIADQMRSLLNRLREKLPPSLQRKLLPSS